jgi:hypothetical protein
MAHTLHLPHADGTTSLYTAGTYPTPAALSSLPEFSNRSAYAAAHVVCDPRHATSSSPRNPLDWDATLHYRHYLWSLGFAVAEAMDTAQRGMGLDWEMTKELIRHSLADARTQPGAQIACGAGTDQLTPTSNLKLDDVIAAYEEQCAFIEHEGGNIILMASRALATCATSPDDYLKVYDRILSQVSKPVILHWLGDMFDPALTGYWGSHDLSAATDICLSIIERHATKIDGIKLSLLDDQREIAMRRRLPQQVKMYTGDDFNYADLLREDEQGNYSHALLGIFDAIAPIAALALQALDRGELAQFEQLLAPTVPLSRHIFQAPTYCYKTGIVFLAYLNGHQNHFRMVAGQESARSIIHLSELFMLADQAGLLRDPDLAAGRMQQILGLAGIQ